MNYQKPALFVASALQSVLSVGKLDDAQDNLNPPTFVTASAYEADE